MLKSELTSTIFPVIPETPWHPADPGLAGRVWRAATCAVHVYCLTHSATKRTETHASLHAKRPLVESGDNGPGIYRQIVVELCNTKGTAVARSA